MTIARILRYRAMEISQQTKEPLSDVMKRIIGRITKGVVVYSPVENLCTGCASKDTLVTRTTVKTGVILRYHKCRFCGNTFQSTSPEEDKKSGIIPDNQPQKIAKKGKKKHIRDRGG